MLNVVLAVALVVGLVKLVDEVTKVKKAVLVDTIKLVLKAVKCRYNVVCQNGALNL